MIVIENVKVTGWEAAIRGMRNPMNSWDNSDSRYDNVRIDKIYGDTLHHVCDTDIVELGPNDLKLAKSLVLAGSDHSKFMRFIDVTLDITAPMYLWKELDTYKVGTVRNSCSTMHKIHDKEFTLEDFSFEHLDTDFPCFTSTILGENELHSRGVLSVTINALNYWRDIYINGMYNVDGTYLVIKPKNKNVWWQMIQLLPSSYNQRATIKLNYAVLRNMYFARRNHKLDEWHEFCEWIESLPYSELITATKEKEVEEVVSDISLEGIDGYIHTFESAAEELRKVDCGELAENKQKIADWLKDYKRLRGGK